MAWRNTPKFNFLYRIAQTFHQHGLVMRGVSATYIHPYERQNVLVMVIGIHGANGQAPGMLQIYPIFYVSLSVLNTLQDLTLLPIV